MTLSKQLLEIYILYAYNLNSKVIQDATLLNYERNAHNVCLN